MPGVSVEDDTVQVPDTTVQVTDPVPEPPVVASPRVCPYVAAVVETVRVACEARLTVIVKADDVTAR